MAANSVISVTELDFDDIKTSMKAYISSRPEFTDYNFEGSTISLLLDLLAFNTYQNAFYTSMVGNEMFLDSAQLRDSVVSRAKMLNYTPRSARGASTTLAVTITPTGAPDSVTIAKNTEWSATVDGEVYKFVTPEAYILDSTDSYSGTITITEGRPVTHRFTFNSNNPTRYIIPNRNVDTTSLVVLLQTSSSDASTVRYNLADDIKEVQSNSNIYFLQEVEDNQYEIIFGDGVLGKAPINGNIVIAQYRICSGTLGNDISVFTNPSTLGGFATYTASVNSATSGGSNNESISSIKFNAPKNFETQNRAVLAEDYKRLVLRDNGDIQSLSVWGGEENNPPIYGKVFISVKPATGTIISQERKNLIKTQLKSYNILSIDTEFVDATYLYIRPTVKVRYDPTITTLSAAQVQNKVLDAIVSFELNNMGTFSNNKFRFSRFARAIDDADASIVSNNTSIEMEKRFNPSTSQNGTYGIAFNNQIERPISPGHTSHSGSHHLSSSSFTFSGKTSFLDDDGEGIVRSYYIDGNQNVIYLNDTLGTVNYKTGLVTLNSFLPSAIAGNQMSIYVDPFSNDIEAARNQILLIAGANVTVIDDTNNLIVAQTREATTLGVTTTVIDSAINTVVY